jgi:SAM-dependent methyltransferase
MSLKEIFQDVYTNWRFGGWPESKSGGGSTLEETEDIRQQIKQLVKDKEIKSVVDAPCGDFNWMKDIVYSFESYTGCDIVPELIADNQKYANSIIKFQEFDITQNEIPEADLLIVRDVIGHLSLEDGKKAIANILNSKCKYLLTTTWYNLNDENYNHENRNNTVTLDAQWERGAAAFYPVCLHSEPFNFPKPELYIEEKPKVDGYDNGVRKGLAFYELDKLRTHFKPTLVLEKVPDTSDLTLVTGLWNVNRPGRDFSHYIENFRKFLEIPVKMFIYIPAEYEYLVWEVRSKENTYVRLFELDDIKNNLYQPFWDKTQEIRTSAEWLNQTGEHG